MSALEPAEVDRVRRALDKDKAENTIEERITKTVIRRRTKKKKPARVVQRKAWREMSRRQPRARAIANRITPPESVRQKPMAVGPMCPSPSNLTNTGEKLIPSAPSKSISSARE